MILECSNHHKIDEREVWAKNLKIGSLCPICKRSLTMDLDLLSLISHRADGENIKRIKTIRQASALIRAGWAEKYNGKWDIPGGERPATPPEEILLDKAQAILGG